MNWLRKIGIIDILIVIVLVAGIFFLINPYRSKVDEGKSTIPIVYTFETVEVGEEFVKQLEIGKDVYNSSKNYYLGKIKDFRVKPYKEEFEDREKGVILLVPYPDRYNVEIDIEANAIIENDVIKVDREEIRVGTYLPIKGKSFASFGYIIGIER
ncbi:MAG: DUF4330 domain-containing protein [Tissierellia bacterium]|nr:DUF4330 domain-containing protein [Tissierellia bacterium]